MPFFYNFSSIFYNFFNPLACETKELNEFTYSLNGFINITEILTESTRFFPSLFQYIFSRLPLSTEKLFFLCFARFAHTFIHLFVETKTEKLNIFSPPASSYIFDFCARRKYSRKISLRATCWLAFNFLFFLFNNNSTNVLDIHTRRRRRWWWRDSEREKWKIGYKSERCEVRMAQTDRLMIINLNSFI